MHSQSVNVRSSQSFAEANVSETSSREMLGRSIGDETRCGCGRSHSNPRQCSAHQRVELAIRHMSQNLDQPLRLATLCSVAGASPSRFFSEFKAATGFSPLAFLIHLRMQRACEVLLERHLNIKAVAARLGYHDQFYFSRLFKQVIGLAPSEYRRARFNSAPVVSDATAALAVSHSGQALMRGRANLNFTSGGVG